MHDNVTTFLEIGTLIKPHGLEGVARVKLYTTEDLLGHVDRVRLVLPDGSTEDRTVQEVAPGAKGLTLLKVKY